MNTGGAFSKLSWDTEAYNTQLKQSTGPFLHTLDPIYANTCGKVCRPSDIGYNGRVGASLNKKNSLVDTESDLLLLNYTASKAPQYKYKPTFNKDCPNYTTGFPNGGGIQHEIMEQDACPKVMNQKLHFPDCDIRTEYSRVSFPVCDLKCTGVNRFQPICQDPQHPSRWEHPSEVGINYRMVVKDNNRPCIPKPIDQTPALPQPLTNKGIPVQSAYLGLPQNKITLTYCTVGHQDYHHPLYQDK